MLRICGVRLCAVRKFLESPPELYRLSPRFTSPAVSADTADKLNRIIDSSEKIHQLRLKRMQLLSLPAASVSGRNKELLSLAIGAVSGALSLSFHPACALIFIFSYRMYRKASEPTRERLAGATNARAVQAEITTETAELDALVSEMRSSLQSIEEKSIESTQQSRSATS